MPTGPAAGGERPPITDDLQQDVRLFSEQDEKYAKLYSVERTVEYFNRDRGKNVGSEMEVKVLAILPNHSVSFWPRESDGTFLAERLVVRLAEEMRARASDAVCEPFQNFSPRLNQPVAAFLSHLGWARGVVFEALSEEKYAVRLIDLGGIRTVSRQNLRPLEFRFAEDPPGAYTAAVSGLTDSILADAGSDVIYDLMDVLSAKDPTIRITAQIVLMKPIFTIRIFIAEYNVVTWLRKAELLKKGRSVQLGTIHHAPSASSVYLLSSEKDFQLMKIQAAVRHDVAKNLPFDRTPGSTNAVRYVDDIYYRATFTKCLADSIEVFFVDYGNSLTVNDGKAIKGILPTTRDMESPIAIYSLADVPSSFAENPKILSYLKQLMERGQFQCIWSVVDTTAQPPKIKIWDENGLEISRERILADSLPVMSPFQSNLVHGDVVEDSDGGNEKENEAGDSLPALQQGYELQVKDVKGYRTFFPGDVFATYVCSVFEPDSVFLLYDDEDADRIRSDLKREIKKTVRTLPKFRDLPDVDTVILARYSVDRVWYRAGVVEHIDGTFAAVVFLDYGNHENVKLENMRPLTETLAKIPQMIIGAMIAGIEPPPGGYTKQHHQQAEDVIMSKKAHAVFRVLEVDVFVTGDLFLVQEGTGKRLSVADMYLAKGIAVKAQQKVVI